MSEPLDLGSLRLFEAVARTSSFSAAAVETGRSQAGVSQAVAGLERQLGRRLFDRTTRRVRITSAGRALRVYAATMMRLEGDVRRHFEGAGMSGEVRIGVVEDFALAGLHEVLGIFCDSNPDVQVSLRMGLSAPLRGLLEEGELHLALTKRLPGQGHARPLGACRLVWAGDSARAGSRSTGEPVRLVTYPEPSETRTTILAALRGAGRIWRVVAESDGLTGQRAAILAGVGIAAFSEGLLPDGVQPIGQGLPPLAPLSYGLDFAPEPHPAGIEVFASLLEEVAAQIIPDRTGST